MPETSGGDGIQKKAEELLQKPVKRRDLLKAAAVAGVGGLAGGYFVRGATEGTEATDPQRNISSPMQTPSSEVSMQDATKDVPERYPFSEDAQIREIEKRLGVRFLTLIEAAELNGQPFNEYDSVEYDTMQPIRWDIGRAKLVEQTYSALPDFFHEPDGQGKPLLLTLTNAGIRSPGFSADYNFGSNLMRFDIDTFVVGEPESALDTVTHESIHRMQDLGYSRIQSEIKKIFNKDFEEFCIDTVTWLQRAPEATTEDEKFVRGLLSYGAQDTAFPPERHPPREVHYEFEAILGQFYRRGHTFFTDELRKVYGDKAEGLYSYMRDTMFGGEEYDHFLTEKKENDPLDESITTAVTVFNNVTGDFLRPDTRSAHGIPFIKPKDEAVQKAYAATELDIGVMPVIFVVNDEEGFTKGGHYGNIHFDESITEDNIVMNRSLNLMIDAEGKVLKTDEPVSIDSAQLVDMARELFRIPPVATSHWSLSEPDGETSNVLITYDYGDYHYEMSLFNTGGVICRSNRIATSENNGRKQEKRRIVSDERT